MPVTLSRRLLFLSFYNYINTLKPIELTKVTIIMVITLINIYSNIILQFYPESTLISSLFRTSSSSCW